MDAIQNFISDSLVIELEFPIKLKTAYIRKHHKIKLPDAIIAATALVYDLTLVTRNTKDFVAISGLTIVNPRDKQDFYETLMRPFSLIHV
jgi:predicted nucleic acid-binding protein